MSGAKVLDDLIWFSSSFGLPDECSLFRDGSFGSKFAYGSLKKIQEIPHMQVIE